MDEFDHGLPDNPYNKHAWIIGKPEIGERVWIGAFCMIDAGHAPLKIGRGTDISSGVKIVTHTTVKRCISERRYGEIDGAATEIGEFCFIGTNAVVLMGVKIGHHSVIAAGAVVPQFMVVPPYSIVAGVPAKIVGSTQKFLRGGVEKESLSIVIPAYNEKDTIEDVVDEALAEVKKIVKDYEIVLVDDGSTDGTGKIINKLGKRKNIRAVHHKQNKGFTGAMKTSFESARKHLVFLAPADGQFDFNQLKSFWEAIRGYDVAIAYRASDADSFGKKIKTKFFHLPYLFLSRRLLGIELKEFSTVSLWRRRVIDSVVIESDDRSAMFLPELISKATRQKCRFAEVPIRWSRRKGGEAKGTKPLVAAKTLFAMVGLWWKLKTDSSTKVD